MKEMIYYFVSKERLVWLHNELSSCVVVKKKNPFPKDHLFYSVVPTRALWGIFLAH
jgi:hypothetical protein